MTATLAKFIPLFSIIFAGYLLQRLKVFNSQVITGLKSLIVNLALPAVLFTSFINMELQVSDVWFYAGTFLFCLLLLLIGKIFERSGLTWYPMSGFFFTGFEFGMVGVALFGSIFGLHNLPVILLFGLGHEIFIWFIYAPLLKSANGDTTGPLHILKDLVHSPIIIAIVISLLLNMSGIYERIGQNWLSLGIMSAADMLSAIVTPLILLVIGASLDFSGLKLSLAVKFFLLRIVLMAVVGTGFILLLGLLAGPLDHIHIMAAITFILLPPPFIIPVFMPAHMKEENQQYSAALMLYTLLSLPLFFLAVLIF